jgi:hypothetical protein
MADWRDTAVDRPGSAASTRRIEREKVASWNSSAASQSNDICLIISGKMEGRNPLCDDGSFVTPFFPFRYP